MDNIETLESFKNKTKFKEKKAKENIKLQSQNKSTDYNKMKFLPSLR